MVTAHYIFVSYERRPFSLGSCVKLLNRRKAAVFCFIKVYLHSANQYRYIHYY